MVVRVARAELLLAMRLLAGWGRHDSGDFHRLLDACGITTLAAARCVIDRYYPDEVIADPAWRHLQERFDGPGGRSRTAQASMSRHRRLDGDLLTACQPLLVSFA